MTGWEWITVFVGVIVIVFVVDKSFKPESTQNIKLCNTKIVENFYYVADTDMVRQTMTANGITVFDFEWDTDAFLSHCEFTEKQAVQLRKFLRLSD